jgi:hypothetical protein
MNPLNALFPVTVMLADFACSAAPAEAQQELLRTWSGATNSVQTKALAVHGYFTNACPIRHVVSILGTNYSLVEFIPGDRKPTTHLGYSFGEDMVYIETTAQARADPLAYTLTGVSYTFSHQNGAAFIRSIEGQPGGPANRSQPGGSGTNRISAAVGSGR